MANRDNVHGEGNYDASRKYNEATKRFVESGKVDEAARDAAPRSEAEAREIEKAEQVGKKRAREEDPALHRDAQSGTSSQAPDKAEAGLQPGFGGSSDNATEPTRAKTPGKE